MLQLADVIEANAEELSRIESENTGKPFGSVMADEIVPMVDQIRFFAGAARVLEGKSGGEYMKGHTSYVRREPRGPIGQVAPWNYPMMMAVWKFAPALAAGNTVVLKPSDTTPGSSVWMVKKMQDIFPKGVANLVCGDRETGAALVSHRIPRMVSITGSTRAGIAVATAAAADVKVAHLELGGKAPVVVFNDADLSSAVEGIRAGGLFNAGQDCTAATRVLCQSGIYDEFVAELGKSAAETRTGYDPNDEDLFYGPINNANQLRHISGLVDRTPDHARVVTGGNQIGDRGYFYEPTVIADVRAERRVDHHRDLRTGDHHPEVPRRRRGRRALQRFGVRARFLGVDLECGHGGADVCSAGLRLRLDQLPYPAASGDAARGLQALRLRQGSVDVRAGGLHPDQARHAIPRIRGLILRHYS